LPKTARDLTEGSVIRNVLYMGIPSMIGFGAMTFYALADIYWVGRLGTEEVAAVTLFMAFAWILGSANHLVGTGSLALIGRRFGEKAHSATSQVIKQTIILKLLIAVAVAVPGIILCEEIMRIMKARGNVVLFGVQYGRVYLMGLPFMFSQYTIYTALRGVGDATKAMYIMLFTTALNMGLDPVFMFTLGMGVKGAAWASVASSATALAIGVIVLGTGRSNVTVDFLRNNRIDTACARSIMAIGFPAWISEILRSAAFWVVATMVATYGTVVVAAYGFGMRILEIGIVFTVGLELGTSAIVSQCVGAKKVSMAEESAMKAILLSLGITFALSLAEILWAEPILRAFSSEPEVVRRGVVVLRLLAVSQPFIGAAIVTSSVFFGSGHTWPPTIIGAVSSWGIQIPLILIFVYVLKTSDVGVWTALIAAHLIEAVLLFAWYKRGSWKLHVV